MEVYGEGCYAGGENGGIVPADATFEGSNVISVEDCGTDGGCSFSVRGDGCWKIRNTNDLPGYEDQPGETFIWLNELSCKSLDEEQEPEEEESAAADTKSSEGSHTATFNNIWMTSMLAMGIF